MANTVVLTSTTTQIEIQIQNLSQPANTYTNFHVDVFYNGTKIGTDNWTDNGSQNSTTWWAGTGFQLQSGNTYTLQAWAEPSGGSFVDVSNGGITGSTQHLSPPTGLSASPSSSSATVYWNSVSGADHYDVSCSSGWSQNLVTGTSVTITGLNPNTYYTWQVRAANKPTAQSGQADDITSWSSSSFTTQSNVPGTPSSAPVLNSRTDTTLSLSWGSSANATSYTVHMVNQTDNSIGDQGGFTNTSGTVVGLQPGTSYSVSVAGQNSYGTSPYTASNTASTNPKTPTCQFVSKTSTTQTIQENNVSGNWTGFIFNQYDQNGTFITSINTSSQTVTFNVTAGATYEYDIQTYWTVNGNNLYSNLSNRITVGGRPNNWQWTTQVDGNGHKIKGNTLSMLATEWNDFTARIASFQQYKNVMSSTFTNAVSGNDFLASQINEAISAINTMSPTTAAPGTASSGTTQVTAAILNQLMDSLNSL